jgi:hypothetical protein
LAVANPYNQQNINLVADELIKRGVKPEVAAGAVAGLMGEAGPNLDPTSFNTKDPGGGSGGIGQWNRGRLVGNNGLLEFAAANGVQGLNINNPQDAKKVPLATQAAYLGHELDTTYSGVLKGLQSVNTGQEGLTTWVNNYENPADKAGAIKQRTQYIQPVSGLLTGKTAPATDTTTASAAAAPIGTTLTSVGGGDTSKLPGFGTAAASKSFTEGLEKLTGGAGAGGQGDQGPPKVQPSPFITPEQLGPGIIPPPAPRNVAPPLAPAMETQLTGYAPKPYGQTLNSFATPLEWGSAPPGASPYAPGLAAGPNPLQVQPPPNQQGAGTQMAATSPIGTSLNSLDPMALQQRMALLYGTGAAGAYGGGY